MTKRKRRILLFLLASLAILGLVFSSTGTVSARRGSPNCWEGEGEVIEDPDDYKEYIMEIRGTDEYKFIPCPGCGKDDRSKRWQPRGGGGAGAMIPIHLHRPCARPGTTPQPSP